MLLFSNFYPEINSSKTDFQLRLQRHVKRLSSECNEVWSLDRAPHPPLPSPRVLTNCISRFLTAA